MKGTQAAVAIGVGYVLGRRKKMRLATMLAIGAASGGVGRFGPAALRQGVKYVGKTELAGAVGPQVGDIVKTIRGDLLDAGKAAAASAVTSRLDSFSDGLHDRAEMLRNPAAAAGEAGEKASRVAGRAGGEAASRAGGGVRSLRRRGGATDEEGAEAEAQGTDGYDEDDGYDDDEYDDRPEGEPGEPVNENEEESAPPKRRGLRSPVARTRR